MSKNVNDSLKFLKRDLQLQAPGGKNMTTPWHALSKNDILYTDGVKTTRLFTFPDGTQSSISFSFFSSFPLVMAPLKGYIGYMAVNSAGKLACK